MEQRKQLSQHSSFIVLISLFFIWGFITCMNDILIPLFKKNFHLSHAEAMIVQFTFFGAYFIGSLLYFIISNIWGDPINKIGYKNSIVIGLCLSAVGSFLFYPASMLNTYSLFLSGLFIIGLGFTLLQISSNPYIAILGKPETASSRLNLAQGFNSLGTIIAPLIGGFLIFKFNHNINTNSLIIPYLTFTIVFIILAIIFKLLSLPDINSTNIVKNFPIKKYPQLYWGILAIFMYVGSEVSIGSILISFLKQPTIGNMNEYEASKYVSMYWTGLMIGRFTGSILINKKQRYTSLIGIFLIIIFSWIFIANVHDMVTAFIYLGFIILNIVILFFTRKTTLSLSSFAIINILLLLITINSKGNLAIWTTVTTGLFNSIMWSNIFTLAIDKLGKYTSTASSLLIMAIVGGAILPLCMGLIADLTTIQQSFFVPMVGYIYIFLYGIYRYKHTAL